MRVFDLNSGTGKLRHALLRLEQMRSEIEPRWQDPAGHAFLTEQVDPLAPKIRATLDALHHLAEVFARAERDCVDE